MIVTSKCYSCFNLFLLGLIVALPGQNVKFGHGENKSYILALVKRPLMACLCL